MKKIHLIAFLGFLVLLSCNKDKVTTEEFNDMVQALQYMDQPDELPEPVEIEVIDTAEASGDYVCSVKRYKAAPGYDEMFLMDPTSDVIFPGAIIKGGSIPTGEYIPILADRKPMTISVSLQNIDGSPSRTVDEPKLSTVREAINDILSADVTGATAAKVSFEIENVYSQEQVALAIQGNYSSSVLDVAASFDFSKLDIRSRLIVKFLQIYYTIDMDLPQTPDDLFEELPAMESFEGTSPLYVSTVTYGRMVLFTVESNYSSLEMNAALNVAFSSGVASGDIDIDSQYARMINTSSVKAYILGGSGSAAVQSVNGIEGIVDFITSGGDYSKESPGAPLSYKMRYLKDNSVANIILASEYNVRQCHRVFSNYRVDLLKLICTDCDDAGDEAEMFGYLYLEVPGSAAVSLWNVSEAGAWRVIPDVGGELEINTSTTFTLENANAESFIYLGGHLYEDDLTGDDDLGIRKEKVYLADFNDAYFLNFNGDGNIASALFVITPIDK